MSQTRFTNTDVGRRFLTVSNLLSIFRGLLVVPFSMVMLSGIASGRHWGAAIMVVAALTDNMDGWFARRLHQTSEWGKILDPLADKIAVGSVAVILLLLDSIPPWFVILLLMRDILILTGGIFVRARYGAVLPAIGIGKWTVGIVAATLFMMVLGIQSLLADCLIAASSILALVSFGFYAQRFLEVVRPT